MLPIPAKKYVVVRIMSRFREGHLMPPTPRVESHLVLIDPDARSAESRNLCATMLSMIIWVR